MDRFYPTTGAYAHTTSAAEHRLWPPVHHYRSPMPQPDSRRKSRSMLSATPYPPFTTTHESIELESETGVSRPGNHLSLQGSSSSPVVVKEPQNEALCLGNCGFDFGFGRSCASGETHGQARSGVPPGCHRASFLFPKLRLRLPPPAASSLPLVDVLPPDVHGSPVGTLGR
ncbi:hypothetical protein K466DRAFT_590110, partial [Polyporus arcularius HHB13444]